MENTISHKEHTKRLLQYMESIAGDTPMEEFVDYIGDDEGLEGVSTNRIKKAEETVVRARKGKAVSPQGLYHLEAIVHKKNRPSHRIHGKKFDPFPGEFAFMTKDRDTRNRIRNTFPAVGRIDITDLSTYGGTGFVVGKNLVMTNRHVASEFTTGVGRGKRVRILDLRAEVDFQDEPSFEEEDGFVLHECVMVHPYWDMALFKADLPDIKPLKLSTSTYQTFLKRRQPIVAIGYPAYDDRNGQRAQKEIFGDEYEVKRIAPGRVSKQKRSARSRWLSKPVAALAHDASTLGGNSGSAIIDVDSGTVAALHFAGKYLVENYGVPAYELARDPRIVDAGVQFASDVPPANEDLDDYWRDSESPTDEPVDNDRLAPSQPRSQQMKTKSNDVTIEVPLRITISLGQPGAGTTYHVAPSSPSEDDGDRSDDSDIEADDFDIGESNGSGYDKDFLSETVPTPKLSKKIARDTFEHNGSKLIHYTHFSVCQSKSRSLPRFVAWNIDGGNMKQLSRRGIRFIRDRRVPAEFQAGNELYRNNKYDRGHVARRADLNWGPLSEAKAANRDSFFFTNMTPQHEAFNQSSKGGLWGELENAVFEDMKVENLKASVMAGPIFQDTDKTYRDVKIPEDFWKLVAFHDADDDEFKVAAYIISQKELVFTEARELDRFHLYQVSLAQLTKRTGLKFGEIVEFDSFKLLSESRTGSGLREIAERTDLLKW
ncbi:DNA/RNA non-specific endonuclease [Roseiconus lacunae]|uniref:DNA/RNA non-specific endonuclease n=1 Tax=Roseiconus lacunae TaxID=2605694 RepID=UPI001E4AE113|nr:DNA/RNA non-specific endonuclease [Roseiconus lacunae]MCD0460688.1 DNA/RNA non-specific endonuclease [Roseiconus lacunae]